MKIALDNFLDQTSKYEFLLDMHRFMIITGWYMPHTGFQVTMLHMLFSQSFFYSFRKESNTKNEHIFIISFLFGFQFVKTDQVCDYIFDIYNYVYANTNKK